jgi:hypothetical protein
MGVEVEKVVVMVCVFGFRTQKREKPTHHRRLNSPPQRPKCPAGILSTGRVFHPQFCLA